MKDRYLVLLSFIIVIIQTSVIAYIEILGVCPSLPIIFLSAGTVAFGDLKGLRIGIYLGVMMDILIGKGLGTYTALFIMLWYLITYIKEKIFRDNFIAPFILISVSSVLEVFYISFIYYLSTSFFQGFVWVFKTAILYSLFNSLVGIPIYTLIMRKYMGYNMR